MSDDRPPDQSPRAQRDNMECIGSFYAHTQQGQRHIIEIWAYHRPVHNRDRQQTSPSQIYLMTQDGGDVDRVDQGEYRLKSNPEVSFSTDDPNAP